MNLGKLNGTKNSLSTFAGEIEGAYNYFVNLIDFEGREYDGCATSVSNSNEGIKFINSYYYKGSNSCAYLGTALDDTELRDASKYSNYSSAYWNIVDGKYPVLINNPVVFTENISINSIDNLFVGDSVLMGYVVNPSDVTYYDYTVEIDDENIISLSDDGHITALKVGTTILTVKANDSTRVSSSIQISVVPDGIEDERIDGVYFIVLDETTKESLIESIPYSGIEVESSNSEYVGTGDKLIYKVNGLIKAEYTIIVKGDLTGDGYVASNDILLMRRYTLDLDEFTEIQIKAGGFKGNGISSANMLLMRRYILGLESEL